MAQLTDIGAQRLYDLVLKGVTPTISVPGAWFTLFTTGPTHPGTGDVELGSYSRVAFSTWTYGGTWPNLTATLGAAYVVDPMPACTVTGWGLSTASTAGELLYFEQLSVPQAFLAGDRYVIGSGSIVVNLFT